MSTDRVDGDDESPAVESPAVESEPVYGDGPRLRRPTPPRAVDDAEITRRRVTLERRASESDVNTDGRPWWVERDERSRTVLRASSAEPVTFTTTPEHTYTYDELASADTASLSPLADNDPSQDNGSGDSVSLLPSPDLGDLEEGEDTASVPQSDGRISSLIRTYVDGLISHVIGTFSGGLLVERKPPGAQDDGGSTPPELATECVGDALGSTYNSVSEDDGESTLAYVDCLSAETFDRETLDTSGPCLGSVSAPSTAPRDVFNKGAVGEGSSVDEPSASVGVLETGGLTVTAANGAGTDTGTVKRPDTEPAIDVQCADGNTEASDGGIRQPDLIISSSLAAGGGCGGGEAPSPDWDRDSDNAERYYYTDADTREYVSVNEDDYDDDDLNGHAALVIAEEVWQRRFSEEQLWGGQYPGDGRNRDDDDGSSCSSSGGDNDSPARERIGRYAAAYRCQTSPADPGRGDGGGWRQPPESEPAPIDAVAVALALAEADASALSDDVFLAAGVRESDSRLTARGDISDDNYRVGNNHSDTTVVAVPSLVVLAAHATATGYTESAASGSDDRAGSEEGVGDIGEGRCDRPESRASEGEAPVICFESISPLDQQAQEDETDPDECVARVASDASDVDSSPPSPEVAWRDEAKIVHIPSNFVQSPDCIDVPQVLYRSYR